MKKLILCTAFIILNISCLFSAINDTDGLRYRYSLFGSYNYNMHQGGFITIPEVKTCCPYYGDGTGSGYSFGASFEISLPYNFFIGLGVSFNDYFGSFKTLEETSVKVDNEIVPGIFEHYLAAKFNSIAAEPFLVYNVFAGFEVFIGGQIGLLFQKDFEHYERIIKPQDRGIFVDTQTRTRNYLNKDLSSGKAVYGGMFFGASYLFPMNSNKTLFLSPYFNYMFGLTEVIKDVSWTIDVMRAGLAIKYFPKTEIILPPPPEEEYKFKIILDTLIVESDKILKKEYKLGKPNIKTSTEELTNKKIITETTFRTDTIFVRPKPIANITANTSLIHIDAQYVTEAFPILPVLFFDSNSDTISEYFNIIKSDKNYSTDSLESNPLVFNKNILNIIGERMKKHPKAQITIKGYADSLTENSDCHLAYKRALTVRNILNQVWGVDTNRVKIINNRTNCFPEEATFTENDSGFAENRRIEIYSSDNEILSPINRKQFSEIKDYSPKELCFDPAGSTSSGIGRWTITAKQGDKIIFKEEGIGNIYEVDNQLTREQISLLNSDIPLTVDYSITDVEGNQSTTRQEISIVKDYSNIEIQRLSLILFQVSSDQVPKLGEAQLNNFIKGIDEKSTIRVTGFSDILGVEGKNITLSQNRAINTKNIILEIAPSVQILDVRGVGSTFYPPGIYSYKTPSERFLSRTVQIELLKLIE